MTSTGDLVVVHTDVLAELGRQHAGLPPTWFCIPAGTRGTVLGFRDRADDERAIIEIEGAPERTIVFMSVERAASLGVSARAPAHGRRGRRAGA